MGDKVGEAAYAAAEKYHNRCRKKHGTPVLKFDQKLNEQAQAFAEAVINEEENLPEPAGLGINEYQSTGEAGVAGEIIVRDAVNEWYENNKDYNWDTPTQSPQNALLFSQIIWKASQKFGIGIATQGDETVVIALYEPAGNLGSDITFKQNVQKLLLK